MKKYFILFMILIVSTASGIKSENVLTILEQKLDKNIYWLLTTHPNEKLVLKKFGAPDLVEKDAIYYEIDGYKYALCIKFRSKKTSYINYKITFSLMNLNAFKGFFSAEDFTPYPSSGHEKGRNHEATLKKEKLTLRFKNNSKKTLSRIIFNKGSK